MTAQLGRNILLKLDVTGSASFQAIGGLRSRSIKLNAEQVDITNSDSTNQWRELLAGAGVKSAEVSGSGVFLDGTYDTNVVSLMMTDTHRDWQVIIPGLGTFQGKFKIATYENTGDYNGEVTFALTLASAGEITFTSS